MKHYTRNLIAVVAIAIAAIVCTTSIAQAKTSGRVALASATTTDPITYAPYGDSLTDDPYGWASRQTKTQYVEQGGYYHSGYTSAQILASMPAEPTGANRPEVAVIMAGTNDVRLGATSLTINVNVVAIAEKSGAQHVIVSALPPSNLTDYGTSHIDRARNDLIVNRDLIATAARHGWQYIDPFAAFRQLDGTWGTGYAISDGVHPTDTVSKSVAARVTEQMEIAVYGSGE